MLSDISRDILQLRQPQVPVRAESTRLGKAPCAMALFTAETIASSDAVMILGCTPTPNRVRRERVVTSMNDTALAALPWPRECSSYERTSKGSAIALTMASMGPDP